jgi:hypothetical protein
LDITANKNSTSPKPDSAAQTSPKPDSAAQTPCHIAKDNISNIAPTNAATRRMAANMSLSIAVPNTDLALISAVFFSDKISGEPHAALATSADALVPAPIGESIRVDVCAFDDVALSFEFYLGFLRTLFPLLPSGKELVAVFEHPTAGRIIFLPNPSNTDGSSVVVA